MHNFNSHAHVERDFFLPGLFFIVYISTHTLTWSVTTINIGWCFIYYTFQLTRSRGAWQPSQFPCRISRWFQLTRSRGAWQCSVEKFSNAGNFNSHAHVERDPTSGVQVCTLSHFNSHAHVERDLWRAVFSWIVLISTHTLTWSVTLQRCNFKNFVCYFNSHAHVERDSIVKKGTYSLRISTHTLTWSVTDVFHVLKSL